MATLTVTASHDYSNDLINDIDSIVFTAPGFALATFSAVSFPIKISNSVAITGDANQNALLVKLTVPGIFSAAGWTVSNWTVPDFIEIDGSSKADTITGPSADDGFVYIRGGGGADTLTGGIANNLFLYQAGDIKAGEKIFGGTGFDTLQPLNDGTTYDFRPVVMSNVEILSMNTIVSGSTSKVILSGSQIGTAGQITTIFGSTQANTNLVVKGKSIDLSTVAFHDWFDGDDTLLLVGTKGANGLTGSVHDDVLRGGHGKDILSGKIGDDIFDFNSKADSPKGAKRDVITDFSVGDNLPGGPNDDLIDLKGIDANSHRKGNQAFKFIDDSKFHHKAGELRVTTDDAHNRTIVAGDINGDGKADFQIELTGLLSLGQADFVL